MFVKEYRIFDDGAKGSITIKFEKEPHNPEEEIKRIREIFPEASLYTPIPEKADGVYKTERGIYITEIWGWCRSCGKKRLHATFANWLNGVTIGKCTSCKKVGGSYKYYKGKNK